MSERTPALALSFTVLLALATLLAVRCADDRAVAPFLESGSAKVELRLVDGTLADAISPRAPRLTTMAPCEPPPGGFPEDVRLAITVNPPSGVGLTRTVDIPARSEPDEVVFEGLAPGGGRPGDDGYRIEVTIRVRGELVFEGDSPLFEVQPGVQRTVVVDLSPPFGRRAVLALGAGVVADGGVSVPVIVSNSRPLRGVEFDLCFDAAVLEPLGAQAVGTRARDFRGAGGQPGQEGIYRAVLWSSDVEARLVPGRDQVLEIGFRFRSPGPGNASNLVFLNTLVTDSPDSVAFTTYVFDGRVQQ
jgi:hypothetical protein